MKKLRDNTFTGASSELIASAWLIRQGYVVFRNLSPSGIADLVIMKDGELTLVDVTTGKWIHTSGKDSYLYMNATKARKGAENNVKVLYVNDFDCYWHDESTLALVLIECEMCKQQFESNKSKSRFCSYKCRTYYWGSKNKANRNEPEKALSTNQGE